MFESYHSSNATMGLGVGLAALLFYLYGEAKMAPDLFSLLTYQKKSVMVVII
jgi:hypothetical protein